MSSVKFDLSPFDLPRQADWELRAMKQLKSETLDQLDWSPYAGITNKAYYDRDSLKDIDKQAAFFKSSPQLKWQLILEMVVESESEANKKALQALNNGCDGILFTSEKNKINSEVLTANIPKDALSYQFPNLDSGMNSSMLAASKSKANYYRELNTGYPIEMLRQTLQSIDRPFCLRTSFADFFFEISYLRALRCLSNQINKNFSICTFIPSTEEEKNQYFFTSTATIAAITGGSQAVIYQSTKLNDRIILNIGNIIREECGIAFGADQFGGSYYVEALTQQLIEKTLKIL